MSDDTNIHLPAGLTPRWDDTPDDPAHCVVANAIRDLYPWAKRVTVGKKEITVYDYRCEHNPDGVEGRCDECVGHGLVYRTPAEVTECLDKFDKFGDCVFPAIDLEVVHTKVTAQDRQRKRAAMADYRERVNAGLHKPNPRTPQAVNAATRRRRNT
jgi:hypothetical protein